MRLVQYFLGLGFAGLLLLSCSTSADTTTAIVRPQLIEVDPQDFLGTVPCSDEPGTSGDGKLHSYVATLFDITPPEDGGPPADPGFQLPSSPATPCSVPVTFSYVIGYHLYRAEVDGYDRDPRLAASDTDAGNADAGNAGAGGAGAGGAGAGGAGAGGAGAGDVKTRIHAVGDTDQTRSGARIQLDGNNAYVAPLWRAYCGGHPVTPAFPLPDAGPDASVETETDASVDAGTDASVEDASVETETDAGFDAGTDAGFDAGKLDAGGGKLGVVARGALTQTVHECIGLAPVDEFAK